MYHVAYRSHTVHETRLLTQGSSVDVGSMMHLAIKPGLTYTLLLLCIGWSLEYVLRYQADIDIGVWGRFVGFGLGLGLAFPLFIRYYTGDRFMRRMSKAQLKQRSVQEIVVKPSQALLVPVEGSKEPCLAFQVDDWTIMLLWGNWLKDKENYELDGFNDSDPATFNGLADPYAFPSTEFTVGRSVHTGMVLSLRPQGTYLAPKLAPFTLKEPNQFKECEFLHGDLSNPNVALRADAVTQPNEAGAPEQRDDAALTAKAEDAAAGEAADPVADPFEQAEDEQPVTAGEHDPSSAEYQATDLPAQKDDASRGA